MDKEAVVHICNEILLSHEKEQNSGGKSPWFLIKLKIESQYDPNISTPRYINKRSEKQYSNIYIH